jgi:hypothetical protein
MSNFIACGRKLINSAFIRRIDVDKENLRIYTDNNDVHKCTVEQLMVINIEQFVKSTYESTHDHLPDVIRRMGD